MAVKILNPMTDKDAAAKLRAIFNDLQTDFHDKWDWMEAEFSLQVLEAHISDIREERDQAKHLLQRRKFADEFDAPHDDALRSVIPTQYLGWSLKQAAADYIKKLTTDA